MTVPSNNPPSSPRPGEEVIREFGDRGTLWLLEDPAHVGDLVRIVHPDLAGLLDFSRAARINRSFIPADLRKEESDLIFRVPLRGGGRGTRAAWVYLLLEHQSRRDPLMPLRLLLYMAQLWETQRREWEAARTPARSRRLLPVVPLVFYTGREAWREPLRLADLMNVPAAFAPFIPDWRTLFLNLHRTPPEALTESVSAVGWALRVLQAERAPLAELERVMAEALEALERLPDDADGQWLRITWYFVLLAFHRRTAGEYTELEGQIEERVRTSKFRIRDEVEAMGRTMAQLVEERGRAEGREQGVAEGRAQGEARGLRAALELVLASRFGEIPPDVAAAIAAADRETLNTWLGAAATAESLEAAGIRAPDREG